VPNAETSLAGGGANTVDALAALLDRIGPSIVIVHSQAGTYGLDVGRKRPHLVKALVTVEGGCDGFTDKDAASSFAKVPVLSLWGDNSVGAKQIVNGDARRNGCLAAVNAIEAAGGHATLTLLPDAGIKGNSHMDDDGQEQPSGRRGNPEVGGGKREITWQAPRSVYPRPLVSEAVNYLTIFRLTV
jgi:hypothetical protein